MIEVALTPQGLPFTIALLVMGGLLAMEILALLLGAGMNHAVDQFVIEQSGVPGLGANEGIDAASGVDSMSAFGRVLAWLYVGRVPVLMLLILLLCSFGLIGLSVQTLLLYLSGSMLPAVIAAPLVFFAALPPTRLCAAVLFRFLPNDETSAIDRSEFVGACALVTGGDARSGLPAQARLTDRYGTDHYVLVEPIDEQILKNGSRVRLHQICPDGRFLARPEDASAAADS